MQEYAQTKQCMCMCACVCGWCVRARVICTNEYNLIEYKIYKKKYIKKSKKCVCMYIYLGGCVHAHMCE